MLDVGCTLGAYIHVLKLQTLQFYTLYIAVGLDVHAKHIMSHEPYLAYGIQKIEDTKAFRTLSKDICSVSPQATRVASTTVASKPNPLSKEIFVIEDDEITNPPDKVCKVEQPVKLTYNLAEM